MDKEYRAMLVLVRLLASVRGRARNFGHVRPLAPLTREEGCPRQPPPPSRVDGPAMNPDNDRQAGSERHALSAEGAAAQCYRDFLLGRVLPARDYLTALCDSFGQVPASRKDAPSDAEERRVTAESVRH